MVGDAGPFIVLDVESPKMFPSASDEFERPGEPGVLLRLPARILISESNYQYLAQERFLKKTGKDEENRGNTEVGGCHAARCQEGLIV